MKDTLYIVPCLKAYSIRPGGVLHVGAGMMEEAAEYADYGFKTVVWVDALNDHAQDGTFFKAVLDSEIKDGVEFHVASNGHSSSLLAFGTHSRFYPDIKEDKTILVSTTTGAAFMAEHAETRSCNVLNVDVQGGELRVLYGFETWLSQFDCIYSEVYLDEVYVGCGKLCHMDVYLNDLGFVRMETWIKPREGWGNAFWVKKVLL